MAGPSDRRGPGVLASNQVLTQEEIDALAEETVPAPPPASPPAVQTVSAEQPDPVAVQVAATETAVPPAGPEAPGPASEAATPHGAAPAPEPDAVARVPEVSARAEKLESSIARLESLEKGVTELSDRVRSLSEQLKTATDRTQEMGGQIETISADLASTPGYGAQRTFQCGACGSSGVVAYQLMCTSCGDENWYGWWPQGQ